MYIRFTCPSCQGTIAASVYRVATGEILTCEHCGEQVDPITAYEMSTVRQLREIPSDARSAA